jgi:molybdate/tungstate transport system ATP-binding protein
MIALESISVRAGSFSLRDISFEVPGGLHGFLMGRTGSGKTTILEAICGLKPVSAGKVVLMGEDVTRLPPSARGIGYVPQDGALFPSMRVRDQLGFALAIRRWSRAAIEQRVGELAEMLGLGGILHRLPAGLSGGESQRVALGRALACHPRVLCLDEPLSALDEETRAEVRDSLAAIRSATGVTILHVTHSMEEARRMADVLFRISEGRVDRAEPAPPAALS